MTDSAVWSMASANVQGLPKGIISISELPADWPLCRRRQAINSGA